MKKFALVLAVMAVLGIAAWAAYAYGPRAARTVDLVPAAGVPEAGDASAASCPQGCSCCDGQGGCRPECRDGCPRGPEGQCRKGAADCPRFEDRDGDGTCDRAGTCGRHGDGPQRGRGCQRSAGKMGCGHRADNDR